MIVTKVGNVFDEQTRTAGGNDLSPAYLRRACDASLRRLDTDRIDVYLIHNGLAGPEDVPAVIDVLEELVAAGKVRWYGWSVSDPAIVRAMAEGPHMVAAQHELNVLRGELETLTVAEELGLAASIARPLAMGLLSGRYRPDALPAADDVRRNAPWWDFFDEGAMERWLERIAEVRAELTADGRSLVQGALGWIWGRSPATLPLPGFRTVAQVEENAGAAEHGPLSAERWSASARSSASRCRPDREATSVLLGRGGVAADRAPGLEETIWSFGPALLIGAGVAWAKLRDRLRHPPALKRTRTTSRTRPRRVRGRHDQLSP